MIPTDFQFGFCRKRYIKFIKLHSMSRISLFSYIKKKKNYYTPGSSIDNRRENINFSL